MNIKQLRRICLKRGKRRIISVLADTNFLINVIEHSGTENRTRNHFRGKSIGILIPKFVFKELRKVKGYSEIEVQSKISRIFHRKSTTIKFNDDIQASSLLFESKYSLAHFPDSMLLACAKIGSYTILTYDRGIIKCAEAEGIRTFTPKMEAIN